MKVGEILDFTNFQVNDMLKCICGHSTFPCYNQNIFNFNVKVFLNTMMACWIQYLKKINIIKVINKYVSNINKQTYEYS